MFEKLLISHCAPTLAGIKTGNLFSYHHPSGENIVSLLAIWNEKLNTRGIYLTSLKNKDSCTLIYIYRKKELLNLLEKEEIQSFLEKQDYPLFSFDSVLDHLRKRLLMSKDFPHEIGVFLGYPLEDVIGFIENRGKNYICTGCWKVYHNPSNAQRLFHCFKNCRKQFTYLYNLGLDTEELLNRRKDVLLYE